MTRKRRCLHCREYFDCSNMLKLPAGWFCVLGHAVEYGRSRGQKLRDKTFKERTKNFRLKDKKHQLKETQKVFNAFIRVLDQKEPCIVHDRFDCLDRTGRDAGHALTVASHPQTRFDPRACFLQCRGSNRGPEQHKGAQSSIREQFEAGIVARFGYRHLEWLKGHHPIKHYTCDDLIDLRKMFSAEKRRLENGNEPSRNWREI